MELADSLATLQYDVAKNEFIKFCKSKDFENLSVKEKKEFLIERKNSSYFIKNLYTNANKIVFSTGETLIEKKDTLSLNFETKKEKNA